MQDLITHVFLGRGPSGEAKVGAREITYKN